MALVYELTQEPAQSTYRETVVGYLAALTTFPFHQFWFERVAEVGGETCHTVSGSASEDKAARKSIQRCLIEAVVEDAHVRAELSEGDARLPGDKWSS